MRFVVVLSALLCAVGAAPSRPIVVPDLAPAVVAAPVAVVSAQSHAQDELGQYSYSYTNPLSSKVETKTVDGVTRGGYSYLDSHGLVQSVNYVSDDVNGFRVAASNLPLGRVTPQEDEPLVAHEKAKAVAALHQAALKDAAEAAVAHENEVVSVPVGPAIPVAYAAHPSATPPVVYTTPAPPVPHEVHVTPAPVTYITPAPVTYVSPSAVPEVHVTPAPYHHSSPTPTPYAEVSHQPSPTALITPSSYSSPVDHHSYATVELDSSDIPAPAPAPGAYFQPSPAVLYHKSTLVPVSTPAPTVYEEPNVHIDVAEPVPSPTPLVHYAPPAPVVHPTPTPVVPPIPAAHGPSPVVQAAPAVVAAPVAVVSAQSHAQDELGQYSYSYTNPLSSKVETKTVDGVTRGGYSYLDSHGLVQNVNYVSDDHHGFRVAASNLPRAAVPVEIPDSEDVAAAKAVFFAEIAKARQAVH